MSARIPETLEEIPAEYLKPAVHQGRIETFEYETYDAFSYRSKGRRIRKKALVYLPYGYDDKQKYNVFYLMHGGGGNERTYLGKHRSFPKQPYESYHFPDIIDHAIEDRKITPLIIVCPTYNNQSDKDSFDFSLAIRLTGLFPQELMNDLIPSVESHYSTYAKSFDPDGLRGSRDHRGFGGFSIQDREPL